MYACICESLCTHTRRSTPHTSAPTSTHTHTNTHKHARAHTRTHAHTHTHRQDGVQAMAPTAHNGGGGGGTARTRGPMELVPRLVWSRKDGVLAKVESTRSFFYFFIGFFLFFMRFQLFVLCGFLVFVFVCTLLVWFGDDFAVLF